MIGGSFTMSMLLELGSGHSIHLYSHLASYAAAHLKV